MTTPHFDDPTEAAPPVASIGSPSSNYELTMDVLAAAAHQSLVGRMLFTQVPLGDRDELALGTVTEVTTTNRWHEDSTMRGLIKDTGVIPNISGDAGDNRQATVRMQACYARQDDTWVQAGTSLSMSPATGTPVKVATDEVLNALVAGERDLHYFGRLHGDQSVRLPLNLPDFSGDDGARHYGVFGVSGSGKSAFTSLMLMCLMRHKGMGFVGIDPQGQWSHENGLPYSVQGFAAELGRPVRVRRISEDLRLDKDAPLFTELLTMVDWGGSLMKMSAETKELLAEEAGRVLSGLPGWDKDDSETVMRQVLRGLRLPRILARVYADSARRARLHDAITQILGEEPDTTADGDPLHGVPWEFDTPESRQAMWDATFARFSPIHNLFTPTNPDGDKRESLWGVLKEAFDTTHDGPRPYVILDMSTRGAGTDNHAAYALLEQDNVKAAILRRVCRQVKIVSESAFRDGESLNTLVFLDEAWRYAPPPRGTSEPQIAALSTDLAGYARDTRKFGVGWLYITQTTRSLNPEIWEQLTVRVFGYGLVGPDLEKVGDVLDSREHLKLYRAFSPPTATNPRVYPWMLTGPVSPLSFSRAPLFVDAYTNFQQFRDDNDRWLRERRLELGLPVLSGVPDTPEGEVTGRKRIGGRREAMSRRVIDNLAKARKDREGRPANVPVPGHAGQGLATGSAFDFGGIDDDDDAPGGFTSPTPAPSAGFGSTDGWEVHEPDENAPPF